jgi:hypothetical protein
MSVVKTDDLILCRGKVTVCSEINTKHLNSLCEQTIELVNIKPGGAYSNCWALKV